MRLENSIALPVRSLQRNRRVLIVAALVAAPALAIAAILFIASKPAVRPLLSLDEAPLDDGTLHVQPFEPTQARELNDDALQEMHALAAAHNVESTESAVVDEAVVDENTANSNSEGRWFNGRPLRPSHTMMMTVTAYSPDAKSCGTSADGITASGYSVYTNGMKLVAADTSVLPFGSLISVPGYDNSQVVPVLDRGGAIKGNRLDVLFPTHEQARQFGIRKVQVTVWEYADGQPSDYVPIYKAGDSVVARPNSSNAG